MRHVAVVSGHAVTGVSCRRLLEGVLGLLAALLDVGAGLVCLAMCLEHLVAGASAGPPGIEQIAAAAARQSLAVPGVLRLQPGLKHEVGRAARALFATGDPDDRFAAAASGVEVSRREGADRAAIEVTLRVITAAEPSPRAIAGTVQSIVTQRLVQLTGQTVVVIVVIVDVEDVDRADQAPQT